MKLNNDAFEQIKKGTKTIELRLNDEKRQSLKIKNLIEFTNRTDNEKVLVEIENLYHYPSFEELYKNFDKWHKFACDKLISFSEEILTYSQTPKLINMTLKYISMLDHKITESTYEYYYIPIDNYI